MFSAPAGLVINNSTCSSAFYDLTEYAKIWGILFYSDEADNVI